jgi:excinuclease ABC subunit A
MILTQDEIVDRIRSLSRESQIEVFVPILRRSKGSHRTLLKFLTEEFEPQMIILDGQPLTDRPRNGEGFHALNQRLEHEIEVQIGSFDKSLSAKDARALVQLGEALGAQAIRVLVEGTRETLAWASTCGTCGTWFEAPRAVHFHQSCAHCEGKGCAQCFNTGIHPDAAAVRWQGLRFPQFLSRSVQQTLQAFLGDTLPRSAKRLKVEIEECLDALADVGLGYISLDRPSPTLSRGEAQRVRLAVALTSKLEDMSQQPWPIVRSTSDQELEKRVGI